MLKEKLRNYYQACGQQVRDLPRYPAVLEARQRNEAGVDDVTILWAEEGFPETANRQNETRLIGKLGELRDKYPHATHMLVVETLAGYSTEFKKFVRELGVRIREEVLLFDAEFLSDVNREASDIAKEIRASAERAQTLRVSQPFRISNGRGDSIGEGADLVERVASELRSERESARMRFLVGPAGAGKTVAFQEIFRRAYEGFQKLKRQRQGGIRPIALTPKHLNRARGNTLQGVIQTFLQTEIARPIGAAGLNWMIDNGQLALMCDGLDEILASDDQFFEFLLDRLTSPDRQSHVVVCVRESLFNTCRNLHEFLVDAADLVEIFELKEWDTPTKREYARKRFGSEGSRAESFVGWLQGNPSTRQLSDNAFYCTLLADLYEQGDHREGFTASQLCDTALQGMLEREYSKGIISKAKVAPDELVEVLEAAAEENLKNGFAGIPVEELRTIAELICSAGMSGDEIQDLVMRLVQLPVFTRSRDATSIDFVHEIIGLFLLARSLVHVLKRDPDEFIRKMDEPLLLGRDVLLRLIAEKAMTSGLSKDLWMVLSSSRIGADAFRVILQIAILAAPAELPSTIKESGFTNANLEAVRFESMDLSKANFQNSDLTDANFERCDLRETNFDGAILHNTTFNAQREDLRGLRLRNTARVHSVRIGKRYIEQVGEIVRKLTGSVDLDLSATEPCPTAKQVTQLLLKFVRPNGQYRRDTLDMRGFLAGREFDGAPSKKDVLDVLSSYGYLMEHQRPSPRVERGGGEKLRDITELVTRRTASDSLNAAISELCPIPGCKHGLQV